MYIDAALPVVRDLPTYGPDEPTCRGSRERSNGKRVEREQLLGVGAGSNDGGKVHSSAVPGSPCANPSARAGGWLACVVKLPTHDKGGRGKDRNRGAGRL